MAETNPGTTNLEAWWTLDEESGNRSDSHGSNTLVDNNTVLYAAGKVGNAANFEADTSENLSIADNASLSTGDIDFSSGCWVNLESKPGNGMNILGKWGVGELEYTVDWKDTTDRFRFVVNDGVDTVLVSADNLGAPSLSTWYFIIAWHDAAANTINIQVNNGIVDSTAHADGVNDSAASYRIGGSDFAINYWDGLVDETFFYKRVLTANEKTWLYNGGNGRTYADLTFIPRTGGIF